jgi:hypothetical protein
MHCALLLDGKGAIGLGTGAASKHLSEHLFPLQVHFPRPLVMTISSF